MKIVEMKGSEVLPGKKDVSLTHDIYSQGLTVGWNDLHDAYNSVEIDGDVEELAKIEFERRIGLKWDDASDELRESFRVVAKSIISQMPKWAVLRKGK